MKSKSDAAVKKDEVVSKRVTLTRKGKQSGRPQSRFNTLKVVQTRVPVPMYRYCKMVQALKYESLTVMFEDMVGRFRAEKPWEHGLHWRKPKAAVTYHEDSVGKTGWRQINIHLDENVKNEVELLCRSLDISMATFCYTGIYWWIEYVYPNRA